MSLDVKSQMLFPKIHCEQAALDPGENKTEVPSVGDAMPGNLTKGCPVLKVLLRVDEICQHKPLVELVQDFLESLGSNCQAISKLRPSNCQVYNRRQSGDSQ